MVLSHGNKKLGADEKSAFLIWNLPAVTTCPNATELCKKTCYARKAERMYPNVLPSRQRNFEASQEYSFTSDMVSLIKKESSRRKFKGKKMYFRIHESGDFYSIGYFIDWCIIATEFPDITFLAYTKSWDIVEQFKREGGFIPDNMVIRYSIYPDTTGLDYFPMLLSDMPLFTVYERNTDIEEFNCIGDCTKCKACYSKDIKHIGINMH